MPVKTGQTMKQLVVLGKSPDDCWGWNPGGCKA